MIYVTSDFHLGHNQLFIYEPRGYKSIEEHDNKIIENWNNTINEDDTVYILGDLMLGDNELGMKRLQSMPGRKLIILGNHDTDRRKELYSSLDNITVLGYAWMIKEFGLTFYLSHYPTITSPCDIDKPLKTRVINLCGHTHTQDRWNDWDKGLIYHCELDAHNCFPIPLEQIVQEIKNKRSEIK